VCGRCGGAMEAGFTTAIGLIGGREFAADEARLVFVVSGDRTSANPIGAFRQGLAGTPGNRAYSISTARCPA
ncbi:MAG TPA: hypothetical protein VMF30_03895, partial [Pirellulales bacterium]|nr:hypothetical protein [Pirellulales bacterium]